MLGSRSISHVLERTRTPRARIAARLRLAIVSLVLLAGASLAQAASAQAAARSTGVNFTNNSDSVLTLTHEELDHGCWATEPPHQIAVGETVFYEAESCGIATGDEFQLNYKLANGSTLELSYDNPFIGSNSYVENAPQGYLISRTGGPGNNAEVTQSFGCNSRVCDGIPDEWKEKGVTIDPGGGNPPQFVDLPHMGVSLERPTIMVQLDWLQDATHDQALRQEAIDNVIRAFSEDPVTYKGATRSGITLVVDAGPESTITPGGAKWGALSRAQAVPWTKDLVGGSRKEGYKLENFYTLVKNNFVPTGRLPIFHYSIAAAEIAPEDSTSGFTPSGLGFIVSLGDWEEGVGSENQQNGTFMHELGHALGLLHGGTDSVNYKPNYPSIMNYLYQMEGVPLSNGTRRWDYSRDSEPNLVESTLTEAGGVNLGTNASGYGTGHACFKGAEENPEAFTQSTLAPVNWTCTGKPALGTGFDANGDGSQGELAGATSDWSRIDFTTGGVGAGADAKDTVNVPSSGVSAPSDEITTQMQARIHALPLSTKLTYDGDVEGDYHDPASVSATLVDPDSGNAPVAEETVTFQLGSAPSDSCSAMTDAAGRASCTITPTQVPGPYTITASFAGDSTYKPAEGAHAFTILREETTLSYDGPSHVANDAPATLSATLLEDGTTPPSPAGQTVKLTLGSGASAQSCSGTVEASGHVQCTIAIVHQPDSASFTVSAEAAFTGDAFYLPSSSPPATVALQFYTARAFGFSLSLLGRTPLVIADTGQVKTAQDSTVRAHGLSLNVGGASAAVPSAVVSTGAGAVTATASATSFALSGVFVPTIRASTITAIAHSSCAGSSGISTIVALRVNGLSISIANAAPNTVIHLLLGGTITLNEQIHGPDHSLTVNALHLNVPGVIDQVQSSATTAVHNCP
jgi:Bacterial Ig-like domain (group 3)